LSIDGRVQPAALNDYDRRWRRVVFDSPEVIVFQRTDDSLAHYTASIDAAAGAIVMTKRNSRNWRSSFTFERPARGRLILAGAMDGEQVRLQLDLVELDTFRLLGSTFRWVRPPDPYAG
jgi:hypothetical protein